MHDFRPMAGALEAVLLGCQTVTVAFLLLHDWVPLGRLSNLAAIQSEDTLARRIFVTLLPLLPTGVCLAGSFRYLGRAYPDWLEMTLWITYVLLLFGLLRAWWIPYLLVPDAARAARYQVIFADTHTFLPKRNGMAPDTLHTMFHLFVVATLVCLVLRDRLPMP